MKKYTFAKYSCGALLFSLALVSAEAQSVTGSVIDSGQLISGTDLKAGKDQSTDVQVFLESTETLTSGLSVDNDAPGYTGPGIIASGTEITDYLIHYDYPGTTGGNNTSGTITFGSDILGLIITKDGLDDTDSILGVSGVTYATGARGLESKDDWSVSGNQLTFNISDWTTTGDVDEVRVILADPPASAPDEASTLALLGFSASMLGLGRRLFARKG